MFPCGADKSRRSRLKTRAAARRDAEGLACVRNCFTAYLSIRSRINSPLPEPVLVRPAMPPVVEFDRREVSKPPVATAGRLSAITTPRGAERRGGPEPIWNSRTTSGTVSLAVTCGRRRVVFWHKRLDGAVRGDVRAWAFVVLHNRGRRWRCALHCGASPRAAHRYASLRP